MSIIYRKIRKNPKTLAFRHGFNAFSVLSKPHDTSFFGLDDSHVCRMIRCLEPILASVRALQKSKKLSKEELENVIIDATTEVFLIRFNPHFLTMAIISGAFSFVLLAYRGFIISEGRESLLDFTKD